jgi:hypothetical protein
MIVTDNFYGNNQRVAQWLLEPGARASLASAQQAGRRLFNMSLRISSSVTSHRLSTCQFSNILGVMKTNSTLLITSYAIKRTCFENLSYSETVIENPKEKDPAKVITRVER